MSSPSPTDSKSPWVQLYEARRRSPPPRVRPRGRPRRVIPRKGTIFYLAEGEHEEIHAWQTRFSDLLGRKVSLGETAGIMARICSARFSSLALDPTPENLAGLVEAMVGKHNI